MHSHHVGMRRKTSEKCTYKSTTRYGFEGAPICREHSSSQGGMRSSRCRSSRIFWHHEKELPLTLSLTNRAKIQGPPSSANPLNPAIPTSLAEPIFWTTFSRAGRPRARPTTICTPAQDYLHSTPAKPSPLHAAAEHIRASAFILAQHVVPRIRPPAALVGREDRRRRGRDEAHGRHDEPVRFQPGPHPYSHSPSVVRLLFICHG